MAKILQVVATFSILIPAMTYVIGKLKYKRKFNLSFILFFLYFLMAFVIQALMATFGMTGRSNIHFIKIYLVLELPLLGLFLLSLFKGKDVINLITISIFTIIPIISNLFFYNIQTVPFEAVVINCLVLSILSIVTIRKVNMLNDRLKNEWYYYIILGIVIYSANNSIVFGFTSLGIYFAYNLHAVLTTLQNILFAIGVWVYFSNDGIRIVKDS